MANPITWRNINAPAAPSIDTTTADAARLITSGLNGFQNLIKDNSQQQKVQWDAQKESNTNNLLAQIAGTRDLESYGALENTITADGLLSKYGAQVDSLKVLNALNGRDDAIRQDVTEQQTFDDTQVNRGERDLMGNLRTLIQTKDFKGAQAGIQEALDSGKLQSGSAATLFKELESGRDDQRAEDQSIYNFNRKKLTDERADLTFTQDQTSQQIAEAVLQQDAPWNQLVANFYQTAGEQNIPWIKQEEVIQQMAQAYSRRQGINPDQLREISNATEAQERELRPVIQAIQTEVATAQREQAQLPTFVQSAFQNEALMSQGELTNKVLSEYSITAGDWFDIEGSDNRDGFVENLNSVVNKAQSVAKQKGYEGVNNAVVLEAIRRVGLSDNDAAGIFDFGSSDSKTVGEFDPDPILAILPEVLAEFQVGRERYDTLTGIISTKSNELQTIEDNKALNIKALEDRYRNENLLLIRGAKK